MEALGFLGGVILFGIVAICGSLAESKSKKAKTLNAAIKLAPEHEDLIRKTAKDVGADIAFSNALILYNTKRDIELQRAMFEYNRKRLASVE